MGGDGDDEEEGLSGDSPLVVQPGRYLPSGIEAGGEHPTRKGWFATGYIDKNGNPLWWKPPGRVSVWLRRISMAVLWLAGIAVALLMLWERFGRAPAP